jgi:hypothetical protein
VVPDGRKMDRDDLPDGTQSQRQPIAGQMVAALDSAYLRSGILGNAKIHDLTYWGTK